MMSHCHFVMTWADQILEWFHGAVFLPPPQPSQSGWESLQSILWMYLSWLIGIYTLEKLASGWSPSASPLLDRSHVVGRAGPAGVFELLEGCLIGKWDKRRPPVLYWTGWASWGLWAPWGLLNWQVGQEETTCLIVVWRPVPLKDLSSNLWRAFPPRWVVSCKELTNFHWRFPGRKRSPSFWNHPIWSSWKPSLLAFFFGIIDTFESILKRWMKLEPIIQSEVSHS